MEKTCGDLPAWQGEEQYSDGTKTRVVISCWELSPEDMEEVKRTGKIYMSVAGQAVPPIALMVKSPFVHLPGDGKPTEN